jgi:hypothetical protein
MQIVDFTDAFPPLAQRIFRGHTGQCEQSSSEFSVSSKPPGATVAMAPIALSLTGHGE